LWEGAEGATLRALALSRAAPPLLTHSPHPPPTTRSAFDGSGADDFFSAGSCIDGRLTSAWEWCSKIDKKAYAPVFKLCSVLGFDGRWEGK
jgi:hypothetical protein